MLLYIVHYIAACVLATYGRLVRTVNVDKVEDMVGQNVLGFTYSKTNLCFQEPINVVNVCYNSAGPGLPGASGMLSYGKMHCISLRFRSLSK